jgi:predicted RNA-binding protein YlxR (DUF448 family)
MAQPIRTCVGCGRKTSQDELVRFVARDRELTLDALGRATGRGAYTCRRLVCFERAESRRAFSRALRRTVAVPSELKAAFEED